MPESNSPESNLIYPLFLTLMDNSLHIVIVHNLDTSISYVNPLIEKITGFSLSEIVGLKAPYPWWQKEDIPALTKELKKTISGETNRNQRCFLRKNGEKFWADAAIYPVKMNDQIKYLISTIADITDRQRLRDEMEFYVREVTRIQEEERKRIARELHDDTAQSLAYLVLELDSILHSDEKLSQNLSKRLNNLKLQTDNSLKEVRRFSHELRPGVLDQLGLTAALEVLTDEMNSRNQIHVNFNVKGTERRLSNEEEQALFRIVQEALSNVRKHSRATQAEVNLNFMRNKLRLTVTDNGKGFNPSEIDDAMAKGRLGLIGMKERVRLIDGTLIIKSKPNIGTSVSVEAVKYKSLPTHPIC